MLSVGIYVPQLFVFFNYYYYWNYGQSIIIFFYYLLLLLHSVIIIIIALFQLLLFNFAVIGLPPCILPCLLYIVKAIISV